MCKAYERSVKIYLRAETGKSLGGERPVMFADHNPAAVKWNVFWWFRWWYQHRQ